MSAGSGALRPPPAWVFSVIVAAPSTLSFLSNLPWLSEILDLRNLGLEWTPAWAGPVIAIWPVVFGAAVYDAFQLAAAVAGRGRAAPGAALAMPLRAFLTLGFALAWVFPLEHEQAIAGVVASALLFAATEVLTRRGAPSPTLIAFVAMAATAVLPYLRSPPPDWRPSWSMGLVAWTADLGALGATWLVLRRVGLDRAGLASVGVRPRTPGELGLITAGAHVTVSYFSEQLAPPGLESSYLFRAAGILAGPPALAAIAYLGALRIRRDAAASARSAAGPTPPGTAAPPA